MGGFTSGAQLEDFGGTFKSRDDFWLLDENPLGKYGLLAGMASDVEKGRRVMNVYN